MGPAKVKRNPHSHVKGNSRYRVIELEGRLTFDTIGVLGEARSYMRSDPWKQQKILSNPPHPTSK